MRGAPAAARIAPLPAAGAADALAALWNRTFGSTLPLGPAALTGRFAAHHDPALLLGAWAPGGLDGAPLGAIWGRAPHAPWSPTDLGYVAFLAVVPEAQGRGIGRALWLELAARLAARGRRRVRIGADPLRLVPGVPQEAPAATWRFLRRVGVRFGGLEHDLHLDLRLPPDPPRLPPGARVRDDRGEAALAFVARVFPGRWHEEASAYLAAGATLLTLEQGGETHGFCTVFPPERGDLAPALAWRAALEGPTGAFGPLGVDPERRGGGRGLALVLAAAAHLRARGARDALIDWTDLSTFYGRAGARAWRTYQRAEALLPPTAPDRSDRSHRFDGFPRFHGGET